jgi:hypothetical protein
MARLLGDGTCATSLRRFSVAADAMDVESRESPSMAEMSAGRVVVDLVKAERVRHLFGIVGATFLDVLDVLWRS